MLKFFKKHVWLLIILFLVAIFPESLTDQAKLNMRVIITGIGIDYVNENYQITGQVVLPKNGTESGGISAHINYVTAEGATISEGIQKMSYKLGKVAELSHMEFILVGESMRQFNLSGCLDYLFRNFKLKNSVMLLTCDGLADECIKETASLELSVALALQKIYITSENNLNAISRTYVDFVTAALTPAGTCELDTLEISTGDKSSSGGQTESLSGLSETENSESSGSGSSSGESSESQGNGNDTTSSNSVAEGSTEGSSSSGGSSGGSSGSSSSGSSAEASDGGETSSSQGGNLNSMSPLQLYKNGVYQTTIKDKDQIAGYYYALSRAKTGNLSLNGVTYGELLNANVNLRIDSMSRRHKIDFSGGKPVHTIDINIKEIRIDEIANAYGNNPNVYNNLDSGTQQAILEAATEQIKEYVYSLYENCLGLDYDIFKTANLASAYKTDDWQQFISGLDGQSYLPFVTLEVNVDFNRIS